MKEVFSDFRRVAASFLSQWITADGQPICPPPGYDPSLMVLGIGKQQFSTVSDMKLTIPDVDYLLSETFVDKAGLIKLLNEPGNLTIADLESRLDQLFFSFELPLYFYWSLEEPSVAPPLQVVTAACFLRSKILFELTKAVAQVRKSRIRKAAVFPLLLKKGWSQADWAAEMKVDLSSVKDYLAGKTDPRPNTRKKMADSLGVLLSDIP